MTCPTLCCVRSASGTFGVPTATDFISASHGTGGRGTSRSSLRAKLLLSYVHARAAVRARRAAHIVKVLLNGSWVSCSSVRTGVRRVAIAFLL
jgi:hypothetical protein